MSTVKKAHDLLDKAEEITLASVSEEGYPRICVLSKIKSEGMNRLWVSTGYNGVKVRHFLQNPKASACCQIGSDSVTMMGNVRICEDRETKAAMWLDWFINHFPGGIDDPTYCVLEFEAHEATIWIDSEFVTVGKESF